MPNTALLNDRVGIPNRLSPVCSDLTGPQSQAWQLDSSKNSSSGELPLVQPFLCPSVGKGPVSFTWSTFLHIASLMQQGGTIDFYATSVLWQFLVAGLPEALRGYCFLIPQQAIWYVPHINSLSPSQGFIPNPLLHNFCSKISFLSWLKKQIISHK